MGDEQVRIGGLSFAPRVGVGWLTDGKLGSFTGPFPQGATSFYGAEASLSLDRIREGRLSHIGRLTLMYYWGHSTDHFSHEDLPLGEDPLLSLIRFNAEREANSHFALAEWRWATEGPVFRSPHWSLIHPEVGVGAGVFYIGTTVREGDEPPYQRDAVNFVATGSAAIRFVEFNWDGFQMGLTGGTRIFAGQAFGIMAEGGLTFAWDASPGQ